ncbi:MAG: nitroreductase [Alphaproteobacteria bacterium]|nr:nitroreductase [Alphaproteobacteria bacterium]
MLNRNVPNVMEFLLSRRSGSAKTMTGPGPAPHEIELILKAATRVPDHGKLAPWRFMLFEGEARGRFGDLLAATIADTEPSASSERLALERGRFLRAPLVIAVISRVREGIPIPEWEQILSSGAVCQNILIAAHALGFVANWITEWYAYHPAIRDALGLKSGERIAGFIYVGKPSAPIEDRPRPDLEAIVAPWLSPASS